MRGRTLVIVLLVSGALAPTQAQATGCTIVGGVIDVTDCTPVGGNPAIANDDINDTPAIQLAIDTLHTAGGGSAFFPAGTYDAAGIVHKSDVRLYGPDTETPTAKLKNIASQNVDLIRGEYLILQGSINNGSTTFTTSNTSGVHIGDQIAIRGAETPSPNQKTTLSSPLLNGMNQTFPVQSGFGFNKFGGYLRVGNEILEFNPVTEGGNSFTTVGARGRFGTTIPPLMHNIGTAVAQMRNLYAEVTGVTSNSITIDRTAKLKVTNSYAHIGAADVTIEDLELDGSRPATGPNQASPARYELARNVTIKDCIIRNGHHGGVHFERGTNDSTVDNCTFYEIGDIGGGLGADLWIFHAAHTNTVKNSDFLNTAPLSGGSNGGIFIDDRTIGSTEWDGDTHHNLVENNVVELHDVGQEALMSIAVSSGTNNTIRDNLINQGSGTTSIYGIRILTDDGQASHPIVATNNTVTGNQLSGHHRGIWLDLANNNTVTGNNITDSTHNCTDEGTGNTFIGHNTTDDTPPGC
jgi:parallel beta-helix repeat protein